MHRNRAVVASVVLVFIVCAAGLMDARRRVLRERQMARSFTSASSHSATYAGAVRATFPMTFAAWIKIAATPSAFKVVVGQGRSSSGNPLVQVRLGLTGLVEAAARDDAGNLHVAAATAATPTGQWVHVAAVWTNASTQAVYLNGANKGTSTGSLGTTTLDRFAVGVQPFPTPNFYFDGDIGEAAVWGAALSDAEVAQLAAGALPDTVQAAALRSNGGWWRLMGMTGATERDRSLNERNLTVSGATRAATHPGVGAFPSKLLVCDGNSLTAGNQSSTGYDYPCQLQALLSTDYEVANFGVSGQTTPDMSGDAASQIDPLYSSSNAGNVLVAWEGTNDLYFNAGATDAYDHLVSYCQARRSAGFRVYVGTIIPRGVWPGTSTIPGDAATQEATFESWRATVNANLRANWSSFADGLVDFAADARLSDYNDTTYFADKIHMTDTGYAIVAGLVRDAIAAGGGGGGGKRRRVNAGLRHLLLQRARAGGRR